MSHRPRRPILLALLVAAVLVAALGRGDRSVRAAVSSTPPVTAGLQLWFEADTETAADGQSVASWTDKSGFGRNLTAASGGEATMRRNAVNGRAAIEFNGSTSLFKTYGSTFTIAQPDTFFLVYRSADTDTSARAFVFDSTNSNLRQVFGRSLLHTQRMYANIDLDSAGEAFPFAGYELWSGTFNGAASAMYRNGAPALAGNAGGSSLSGFTLGGLSTSGTFGYDFSHSLVAEVLVYSGTMTSTQQQSMVDWLNQKYAFNAPPTPPVNTAPPVVTGTAVDGATVSATTGTFSGTTPMTFAQQWQRCDSGGANCTAIAGATSPTYSILSGDVGSKLKVAVTATNSAGSATATSAASAVIAPGPPVNTVLPVISGTTTQGQALATTNGTWGGTAPFTYAYEWRRCDGSGANCVAVATTPGYTLVAADLGSTIRVAVTATNAAGSAQAVSAPTAVVTPALGGGAPPLTTGLQLWYDASQEAFADGAPVARWTDRSGFGRDLTSFDTGSTATYRSNAVNGRPAIEFNGSTSLLKTYGSTFTIAQPDTFFLVYRQVDLGDAAIFDSRNSAQRQTLGRSAPSNIDMYSDVDLLAPGITFPFPGYQLWTGVYNGNASTLSMNGTQLSQGRAGSASQTGLSVGALSTSGQYGYQYSHSYVAEILWYSGALTAAQQQQVTTWLNSKYAFLAPPSPPSNTVLPVVTGSASDGATVTATNGTWSGTSPFTYAYQWQRCNGSGASCVGIAGATNASYTVLTADVGSTLRVVVTATNSVGSASATSTASAVVAPGMPVNMALPVISGTTMAGQALATTNGTWGGTAPFTYAYEWRRCDGAGANCIAVATTPGYTLVAADVGSTIRVAVTATNAAGSTVAVSAPTVVVSPVITGGPPVTAGLQLWFDASQEAYANGAPVARWTDRSGFGRDLTSFDAGSTAIYRSNAVNGRPAIEFNGSTSLLKTYGSTFTIAQPDTFFLVYKQLDAAEAYIFDSTNSAVRQLFGRGPFTDLEMYADVDLVVPTYTFPFANYELWSGTYNGNSSTLTKNGTTSFTGRAGSASLSGFSVGALSTSGQYGYAYSHSLVAEILWYSGNLSAADRSAVTTWLKNRYAIP